MMIGMFLSGVGVWRGGLAQWLWWFLRMHHLSTSGIAASHRFLKNMTFVFAARADGRDTGTAIRRRVAGQAPQGAYSHPGHWARPEYALNLTWLVLVCAARQGMPRVSQAAAVCA